MASCAICLTDAGPAGYHRDCVERLFGTAQVPAADFDLASLYRLAAQMAGKMSISGVQEKVSLGISAD
ncbi:MAG TPA: hypothetical protein VML55_12605, partial [Planctomycetaceae bacterium]|nr:hypothetical protein [Planctomycetaceae bacterium]